MGGEAVTTPSASTPVATKSVANSRRQRWGSLITLSSVMPTMTPMVTRPPAIVNNAHVAQIQPAAQGVVPAGYVVSHNARIEKSTKK